MANLSVLVLNCFLLRVAEFPARRPLVRLGSKPRVTERATEIGATLNGQYDVACLTEVFDEADVTRVSTPASGSGPQTILGPAPQGFGSALRRSSGLVNLVDSPTVVATHRHSYEHSGSVLHEPDPLSSKGALFIEVDTGLAANLEIVTTHLIAGGDLLPRSRPNFLGGQGRDGDHAALRVIRQAQAAELAHFVARHHQPENPTLIVGDFNVARTDPLAPDPEGPYTDLVRTLGDPVDLWDTTSPGGHGATANLLHPEGAAAFIEDPDDPRFFLDDGPQPSTNGTANRIDYAFLATDSRNKIKVKPSVMRRRHLPRAADAPGIDSIGWLSDHAGLHLELDLS